MDLVDLEGYAFLVLVILDVLMTLVFVVTHPVRPSAGFLFYFEKCVNVRGEHVIGSTQEMPHLVHVLNDVALVDGCLQFSVAIGCEDNDDFVSSTMWVVLVPRRFCTAGR